jgi:HAD superfamily hydrolase (TIGR01484 family)
MQDLRDWTASSDPHFGERTILAFDLDDTLTEDSELTVEALEALFRAREAGLTNVLVTGRPASWADALLRLMPFDAAVAENGSVVFWKSAKKPGAIERLYWKDGDYVAAPPSEQTQKALAHFSSEVIAKFPKFRIATDQSFRLYDVAFDFAESVRPALSLGEAQELADFCASHGYSAKVSNIHVNVWKGDFTKIEGLRRLVEGEWKKKLARNVVYTGDSPNDGPLFGAVEVSVGVANVRDFVAAGVTFSLPRFVTRRNCGEGAAELIAHRIALGGVSR